MSNSIDKPVLTPCSLAEGAEHSRDISDLNCPCLYWCLLCKQQTKQKDGQTNQPADLLSAENLGFAFLGRRRKPLLFPFSQSLSSRPHTQHPHHRPSFSRPHIQTIVRRADIYFIMSFSPEVQLQPESMSVSSLDLPFNN